MPFTKFVEVGRAVYINYGPDRGKLAVIVNVLNHLRVQIDGTEVKRQIIPVSRLQLTKFKLNDVLLGQRTGKLTKKIQKFNLREEFNRTSLGLKIQKQSTRANLSDFDRFKVMVLKKRLNRALRGAANKARTTAKTSASKQSSKKTAKAAK